MAQCISENEVIINFWLRNSKGRPPIPEGFPKDDKFGTIYVKIRYQGKRIDLCSTQINCWRSQWVPGNPKEPGKVINQAPYPATDTAEANGKIVALFGKIRTLYAQLRYDPQFNVEFLKGHILGSKDVVWRRGESTEVKSLVAAYLEHDGKRFEAGEIAPKTIYVRSNYIRIFGEFLVDTKRVGLRVGEVRHETFDTYKFHLLKVKKFNPAYVAKCLQYVRQAFRWGKQNKIITENPLSDYIIRKCESEPDTTHLEEDDLNKLIQFDPYLLADEGKLSESLARIMDEERDALVFTCLTGMHDIDYRSKAYEVVQDKSGHWLKGRRTKTKTRFEVPIDPYAMRIIRKYGGIEKLPIRSNQKRNHYLKLLSILIEIPLKITTKIGRKTFADRALNDMNMDAIDVASMLGHTDTKQLKHYARIQNRRLIEKFVPLHIEETEGIRRLPVPTNHLPEVEEHQIRRTKQIV